MTYRYFSILSLSLASFGTSQALLQTQVPTTCSKGLQHGPPTRRTAATTTTTTNLVSSSPLLSWNNDQLSISSYRTSSLASSMFRDDDMDERQKTNPNNGNVNVNETDEINKLSAGTSSSSSSTFQKLIDGIPFVELFKPDGYKKLPPMQVEDMNLLLYDVFLLVNLTLSISFWVTHRMSFEYLPAAFNEGSLLSIFWIGSGLYHGSFLASSVDGHYKSTDEESGPKAAAILALNTYVNAINLRLLFALITAVVQHRQVGIDPGEQLVPLEIGFGLVLMTFWRAIHSSYTPRY